VIEIHSPLDLVILMLGTNDFQSMHTNNAWHSAQGIRTLITAMRRAPIEPEMSCPPILVIAPPPIQTPKGPIALKFRDAESKCVGAAQQYAAVAKEMDCFFFDAGSVVASSEVDGIHLDKEQHTVLGLAVAETLRELLK